MIQNQVHLTWSLCFLPCPSPSWKLTLIITVLYYISLEEQCAETVHLYLIRGNASITFKQVHHSGKVRQALSYRMERQKLLGTKENGQGIKPSQRRGDARWQLKPVSEETVTTSLLTDDKAPCQNLPTQEGA